MKTNIKKILSILIILIYSVTIFAEPINTNSSIEKESYISTPSDVNITNWPKYDGLLSSKAAFVMDADSSIVLFKHNESEKMYPASLTKVMTAIIVFDKLGNNLDDLVTFSYNSVTKDIDKHSVTIGASAGDQLTVKDCLYSLLLPSANDVANALAEHIAGSTKDFALLMNEKAKNLGLSNTNFVNPSGLHDDMQYTTAEDMSKIMKCAMQYPMFLQISSSVSYKHAPIRKYKNPENSNNQVLNTNSIMVPGSGYYYNGITSGKTGHTDAAGYNLAASAKKNGMHLICVVLGGKSEKERFTDAKNLFDFHFNNYKSLLIKEFDARFAEKIDTFAINDVNLVKTLSITCDDKSHITLPKDVDTSKVKSRITYQVKDIYNRYAIGYITYTYNNKVIGECTLEGRNFEEDMSIYTNHLNINKLPDDNDEQNTLKQNTNTNDENKLIYRNANGALVISKTLTTMLALSILFILFFAFGVFFYTRILSNANFPINKLFFRIRRYFKNK